MKRETWDSLIGLVFAGENRDWTRIHEAMDEARGAVLAGDALRPPRLLWADPTGSEVVVRFVALPGVRWIEPRIRPRVFWELTGAGAWREVV